jgi:hypothetical protein
MWAERQDADGPSIDTALLLPTPTLPPRNEMGVATPASPVPVAEEMVEVSGGMLVASVSPHWSSNDDSEPDFPPLQPARPPSEAKGGSSSTRRVDRPLRKNTGVQEDFAHTPLMGAPTNGVTKLEFFGEYLKTLLLEAPQPLRWTRSARSLPSAGR